MKHLFEKAFREFLERERSNIIKGVSERNLCARFATYLESNAIGAGLRGYYADVEYNRNQGRVKTIIDNKSRIVVINCDVILHSRGEIVTRDNLIAIEMKKAGRPEAEKERDRDRLRALTKSSYDDVWSADKKTFPEHVCGYELGYFIELDVANTSFRVEEFRGGNLLQATSGKF